MAKFITAEQSEFIDKKHDELVASGVPSLLAAKWANEFGEYTRVRTEGEAMAASVICRRACALNEGNSGPRHLMQALAEYEQSVRARLDGLSQAVERLRADADAPKAES